MTRRARVEPDVPALAHEDRLDCWCGPRIEQACPECEDLLAPPPDCYRCGGEGWIVCTDPQGYDGDFALLVTHVDSLPEFDGQRLFDPTRGRSLTEAEILDGQAEGHAGTDEDDATDGNDDGWAQRERERDAWRHDGGSDDDDDAPDAGECGRGTAPA